MSEYDELNELNIGWRASISISDEILVDRLEQSGMRFVWDVNPSGWLRFSAINAHGARVAYAVAWPGAYKNVLVSQVLLELTDDSLLVLDAV